ncbi:hypothetical protein Tco_0620589, partial [Tanacetum coccineum]
SLVPDVFVSHYEQFLGSSTDCNILNEEGLFSNKVPADIASKMVRDVTNEEIKAAMFDIGDDRAPGPDGYTFVFFKKGWNIVGDDICNAEVMHNYHRNQGSPRCAFKIDIQKAYDTILTLILKRRVRLSESFRYHRYCEEIQLIDMCFANDLFIFAHGDVESSRVIMDSLEEFKLTSALISSIPKSTAYFCNVLNHTKAAILSIMPFSEGELPVKYLGVPLISSRLLNMDCKILVEKAKNRTGDWKNKSLSFAGRLQLCKSLKRGKAKIAWEDICLPKSEGGLGLCNLEVFNFALMTTHIWNIISSKESLWVRWIHTYKLRGRTIYDVPVKDEMSWGWHKLLQLRDIMRPFFWVKLGNGNSTSLWYDNWCSSSPLINYLTSRDISREGFLLTNTVADLVSNGTWSWPQSWLLKAPDLGLITCPALVSSVADLWQWRDQNGNISSFSVAKAWEAIRPRGNLVAWSRIVWFSHNIPFHAFHLWLVMRHGLKTHDKIRQWDVRGDTDLNLLRCALCDNCPDSHTHLFFECTFSAKVWSYVRDLAGMDLILPVLQDILLYLLPMGNKRTAKSVFGKLILAASAYFIWMERNNRTFKNTRRESPAESHTKNIKNPRNPTHPKC